MREIKFRAWNVEQKKWVIRNAGLMYPRVLKADEDKILVQSIGLKDKNGKEIYEGDILKVNYSIRVVEWLGHFAGFILRFTTEEIKDSWEAFDEWDKSDLKIIGNIYENPELLKK